MGLFKTKSDENWKINYIKEFNEMRSEYEKKILSKQNEIDDLKKQLEEGVSEKLAETDRINAAYLRKAIKELNHKITDDDIDKFKETYGDFAWAVSFAPADNPEIAICVMIPQGNTSTYALLPMKDIIGQYMGLNSKSSNSTANKTDEEKDDNSQEDSINFSTQLKK